MCNTPYGHLQVMQRYGRLVFIGGHPASKLLTTIYRLCKYMCICLLALFVLKFNKVVHL